MKRDLPLFRQILSHCERSEEDRFVLGVYWPGDRANEMDTKWTAQELYHLKLMRDAGLIVFSSMQDIYDEGFSVGTEFRVTNAGHDFLDAIRDEKLWEKTKDAVAETGGSASIEILTSLAKGFLKKKISHHTGIDL